MSRLLKVLLSSLCCLVPLRVLANGAPAGAPAGVPADVPAVATPAGGGDPQLLQLGPGDVIGVEVYGQPDLSTTTDVSAAGTIAMPLAGTVQVGGLAPADAALRIADALRKGQYVLNPQVTVSLKQYRSAQVSVLGEVKAPGRFPIESRTTVFDLLAEAGGTAADAGDIIYIVRSGPDGQTQRHPVKLAALGNGDAPLEVLMPRGGDIIYVPRASQFYIYGEVQAPNRYKLDDDETVVEAIARAGGVTQRGSIHRIEIRRKGPDGKQTVIDAHLDDPVQPDDVIRVKERLF